MIFWNRSHQSSSNDIDEEEYSNSSRLHLAGDNSAVVESFYQSVGGGMKNWKLHSLHIISLIVTHLCSSFQGNQLVITLHTIHFYQKDWNPQIHLHLICGNLKGIYLFPQVLCHCYECAMKHTKCQKSSSTLRKPSYFLRKNVTFSKKGFSPLLKATRYFN